MYAVTISRQKFMTEEHAKEHFELMEDQDRRWGRVYKRILVGCEVQEFSYDEVHPYQLDGMFQQQMQSMDNKLATGADKRTSKNGHYQQ